MVPYIFGRKKEEKTIKKIKRKIGYQKWSFFVFVFPVVV